MKNKIFLIAGPSGTGKGSVVDELVKNKELRLAWAKTVTTRPRRPDDKKLSRRIFVSDEEFTLMEKSGEILEKNHYNGYWYGTPKSSIEKIFEMGKNPLIEVDINGVVSLKKIFGSKLVSIFIYSTLEELKSRLIERGMDANVIEQRLEISKKELAQKDYCDYSVHNKQNKLEETIGEIERIINSELED